MSEMQEWYASGRDRADPVLPRVPKPNWFAIAVHASRNGSDGLARHLKVVPKDFVRPEGVLCVCESLVALPEREFTKCPNGCRWFYSDAGVVWAARLPDDA